jgi:glycosyltransferase involved in cell wall biosynthesis
MKILFFNYEFPPLGGGAGNASFYLLREYAKNPEIEVDFVTSSIDDKYHLLKMGENITIHSLPIGKNPDNIHYQTKGELIRYSWRAYWFSRKLAKKNKYDLTHSFFSVPCGFISMLLKWEYKLPYIVSLRGSDVPYYSERFTTLYKVITPTIRLIWNQSHFVVANSLGLRELALKSKPNKDVGCIYNGIDIEQFYPRPELKDPTELRLICGTRVTPRKGIRLLIQAVDILLKRYPNVRLSIVGEGDEKKSLQDLTQGLGINSAVTFLGFVPREKAAEIYGRANIYVSPSFNEGMANFMLECMALGMPILATDVGGTRELLTENENGFIIKTGEYNDIVDKIEKFLLDKSLVEKLGNQSRLRAEKMSWEKVSDEYIDLYEKTVNFRKIRG